MNIEITIPAFLVDWPFWSGFGLAGLIAFALFVVYLNACGPRF